MSTNIILAKETMTYAEYINRFTTIHNIKKHLIKLHFPLDELPYFHMMTEEEVFLKQWDIEKFGLNTLNNNILSTMWLEKEQQMFFE